MDPSAGSVVIVGGGLSGLSAAVFRRLYEWGAAMNGLRALDVPIHAAPRGPNGGFAVWRGQRFTLPVSAPASTIPDVLQLLIAFVRSAISLNL